MVVYLKEKLKAVKEGEGERERERNITRQREKVGTIEKKETRVWGDYRHC